MTLLNSTPYILCFWLLLWGSVSAAEIVIHTDNAHDFESFQRGEMRSLSSETNMLALSGNDVDLRFEFVPLKRSLKFMEKGDAICVLNKIKTSQRAQRYIFSKPINLFLSRRLYQFSDLPLADINEPISLATLFAQYPQRRLIVSDQISYGDKLDKQIAQLPTKNKIVRRGASHVRGMLDMFSEKRGEYALFYPLELNRWQWEEEPISYAIAGVEPYLLGRLMCVNREETNELIRKVNNRIDALNQQDMLLRAHLKYYLTDLHQDVTRFLLSEYVED